MRAVRFAVTLATLAALAGSDLAACGDKYIRLAQRLGSTAENPAAVLIYMPPESVARQAAKKLRLHQALRLAGHRVEAVDTEAALENALGFGRYDIVIADEAAEKPLAALLERIPGRPSYLPIFHKTSDGLLKAARKRFGCIISANYKYYYAVGEVDHLMSLRKIARAGP